MRLGRLGLGMVAVVTALAFGWLGWNWERAATAALDDETLTAIEVGCRGYTGRTARECRSLLKRLYLSGSLEPGRTLDAYCASVENAAWGGGRRPAPPPVCVERDRGWARH